MQSKGMLEKPCLYISDYIERNKEGYYDFLTRVRTQNDMILWIKFFLETIIETASDAKTKFKNVLKFTAEMDKKILELNAKPENVKKVLNVLYNEPKITRNKIAEITGLPYSTIKGVINSMLENRIIVEKTGYSRNQIFSFDDYIELFLQ